MNRITKAAVLLLSAAFYLFIYSCSEPVIPQGYALVYGVADYEGTSNDLNYTDDDARSLAELLNNKGWQVTLKIDPDMTDFNTDISTLSSAVTKNDRFLFYFSGHGLFLNSMQGEPSSAADNYDELLALRGSLSTIFSYPDTASIDDVKNVTLTEESLAEGLAAIAAENKIVIIDACYSGGFVGDGFTLNTIEADYTQGEISTVFTPAETLQMYLNYAPTDNDLPQNTFTVLTASGESELSYELGQIEHGVFTYYLLNSPAFADYNFDGYISVIEAYRFAADNIDASFNDGSDSDYYPNIAAFPVDPVLFPAD